MAKGKKNFVYEKTIRNNVPGALSYPGDSQIVKVGTHKVLLSRADRLDKYGNPVHTAMVIDKEGTVGKKYRSNGGAVHAVSGALKKSGIGIKYEDKRK